jgi:hypothetical protein
LEKDFDELMELDNCLDITIQDLEHANAEVSGLLKHLYNVIKFQEPSDGHFTVIKIMGGVIGEFVHEAAVSVRYSQHMYVAVFQEVAGVRGRVREQLGSQYLRAAGLADGLGCGFDFYASSLVLSSGRRGAGRGCWRARCTSGIHPGGSGGQGPQPDASPFGAGYMGMCSDG